MPSHLGDRRRSVIEIFRHSRRQKRGLQRWCEREKFPAALSRYLRGVSRGDLRRPFALLFALLEVGGGHCHGSFGPRGGDFDPRRGSVARFGIQTRAIRARTGEEDAVFWGLTRIRGLERVPGRPAVVVFGSRAGIATLGSLLEPKTLRRGKPCCQRASLGAGRRRSPKAVRRPSRARGTPKIAPLLSLGILLRGGGAPRGGARRRAREPRRGGAPSRPRRGGPPPHARASPAESPPPGSGGSRRSSSARGGSNRRLRLGEAKAV
jgi:hypothetical protein